MYNTIILIMLSLSVCVYIHRLLSIVYIDVCVIYIRYINMHNLSGNNSSQSFLGTDRGPKHRHFDPNLSREIVHSSTNHGGNTNGT